MRTFIIIPVLLFSLLLSISSYSADFNKDVRIELQQAARSHFDRGCDFMISGHYHLGEIFTVGKGKLAVLGDWFHKPSYAVFDGNDLKLVEWENDG